MAKKEIEINPFVHSLEIKVLWKLDYEKFNHITDVAGVANVNQLDVDDRCSVYSAGLLSWFPGLSSSAKDMFMYIAVKLGYEKDVIELEEDNYCTAMNIGRTTFYKAKTELTERLILPRKARKNTYWVNPSYLFKGNRPNVYPDKIVETNTHPFANLPGHQHLNDKKDKRRIEELYNSIKD